MRIIEPRHKASKRNRRNRSNRKKRLLTAAVFLLIGGLSIAAHSLFVTYQENTNVNSAKVDKNSTNVSANPSDPPQLLSGEQFQQFYESLIFPNTQLIESSPAITGHKAADARIIQIAESRGYVLRSVPVLPIVKTNEPNLGEDDLLQPKANQAWQELKAAAQSEGIDLVLTSAYRSVDRQRALFLQRLGEAAKQPDRIAAGEFDGAIVGVLSFASPPGYSRHHTGYTIDLRCGGDNRPFEVTACFYWMNNNNYENAKKYGWIPSYPDGVDDQGPEPEPWEYVWVGRQTLGF